MPTARKKPRVGRPSAIEALVRRVERQFQPIDLPKRVECPDTQPAQDRLQAALSTVNNVFLTMNLSRSVDRDVKKKDLRGRLSDTQVDILRSAITFACAGDDAALKKLIKDTVRRIAVENELARKKFLEFIDRHLAAPDSPVDRRTLGEVLIHPDGGQAALLERYERELTGDSLQSAQQVALVCGALGVEARAIRERLKEGGLLDKTFRARNKIVHELDLDDGGRVSRKLPDVQKSAKEVLAVTQEIINDVGTRLSGK